MRPPYNYANRIVMQKIDYSIIVPLYNGALTISDCVEAILSSDIENYEIIVVDDCSTDNSAEHVPFHSQVSILSHNRNKGPSAARNTGAKQAKGDTLIFIDSDTLVRPNTLSYLLKPLLDEPNLLGTNGIFAIDLPPTNHTSDFVNTSIHFQHIGHGKRVNTTFTAICALRRSAFLNMGGWDERRQSRYADDINTRWQLPPKSLLLVTEAQVVHKKNVSLLGMLTHRFNIGYHFVKSLDDNASSAVKSPMKATLHYRYPINTAIGFGLLVGVICPPIWLPLLGIGAVNNAEFMLFTLRKRNLKEALISTPLSLAEGVAYALGIIQGGHHRFRA